MKPFRTAWRPGIPFLSNKRSSLFSFFAVLMAMLLGWSAGASADESFWTELSLSSARSAAVGRDVPLPSSYRAFTVDLAGINVALDTMGQARSSTMTISLPHPEGGFEVFEISPSGVMAPELAAQFPEIRAFTGRSNQDARSTLQLEVTPRGVTAQVLAPSARWMIDPLEPGRADAAISYMARHTHTDGRGWKCDLDHDHDHMITQARENIEPRFVPEASRSIGQSLRTYRLAVSASGEYSVYHGTTKAAVQAAITTTINRVAGIYEKELAISFQLIGTNADIIFLSPGSDPYTNAYTDPGDYTSTLMDEAQKEITDTIGSANFDIGHVFSTGPGGIAGLGVVCKGPNSDKPAEGDLKAQGMTGRTNPIGDAFDVDYVAHEIGHQFSGNHTYNGTVCTTGNPSTAYEPGSGSTIQAYAGICGSDNLQINSDPIFSAASFDEMIAYVEDGSGASCGSASIITHPFTNVANNAPAVNAGSDYTVPNNTPIVLTGSATDSDGDSLTYLWEQRDLGPKVPLGAQDNGESPLFRVFAPTSEPTRYLPQLTTVVSGVADSKEIVPSIARAMQFRLTARDNRGGVNSDDMVVNVAETDNLLPSFVLIEPSEGGESLGSTASVSWSAAGTYLAPINASEMEFYLSTDSGATFSATPFATAPNNGFARITFPGGISSSTARLMIKARDNIFYDVSDNDFTLNSDAAATPETPTPTPWSLVPTNGGADLYFGPGVATGGTAGVYAGVCRGELLQPYSASAAPGEDISASQPEVTNSLSFGALGSVPSAGLSLDLNVTHVYRGDLKITLTSPAGTVVSIKDKDFDSADDVVLDDYKVGGFAGETLQGNWTLTVTDTFPQADDGTWVSWGLSGNGRSAQTVTVSRDQSPISFTGMNNGWDYLCELTGYDDTVSPTRGSATVFAGVVRPSSSPVAYTVTPSASAGGSIDPDIALPVASGNTINYTLIPDTGYEVNAVGGTCGGAITDSVVYKTSAISGNCTVQASFTPLAPGVPTIVRTDSGDGEITLYVTAGSGGAPTSYTATCTDGANAFTATSATSPITVSGLKNDVAYTCSVVATNNNSSSGAATASSTITPEATGGLPIWLLYQASQQ